MEICNKGRLFVFGILGKSLSSYNPHIKSVDPPQASRGMVKTNAFLYHCGTDSKHSIFYIHNTGGKRCPFRHGNEYICLHHQLTILALESFTFPYLGTNCDTCPVFLIEIDKTFFESTDHVTCLHRLWNLDCQ